MFFTLGTYQLLMCAYPLGWFSVMCYILELIQAAETKKLYSKCLLIFYQTNTYPAVLVLGSPVSQLSGLHC